MSALEVVVVGAGAWGTALATVLARAGNRVRLFDADRATIDALAATRRHPRFAGDVELDRRITPVTALAGLPAPDLAVFVVPFQALRAALTSFADSGTDCGGIACASKGLETDTLAMAHEIAAATCAPGLPFAQVSGPNFADEVMHGAPAAITVAAADGGFGETLVGALHSSRFRPYLTDDVIGVEIGGALKNVIAIAAGIADGLALGSNTRAALITRGLAEMARYGCARGGRMETFMGLSGIGDLVLTCTDDQSRNRRFGLALARHGDVERAAAEVGALVEGVATARALAHAAAAADIEMPIAREVAAVLDGVHPVAAAVDRLLAREPALENP